MASDELKTEEDFEIAVICALPLEANAVICLFDEIHDADSDRVEIASGDPNHYTTGRIGHHNVVLTLLPGMGKAHAASAAASLRLSFRKVRLALLVGICGGVPGPHKDREQMLLGDVVISNALVQFDYGRQYPDNLFLRKCSVQENLGKLNKDLRATLKCFETDHYREKLEETTARFLIELQATHAKRVRRGREGKNKYRYPGTHEDKLYHPKYHHRHSSLSFSCCKTSTCDVAMASSCKDVGCEEVHLEIREELRYRHQLETNDVNKAQEPAIFIGAVGSGDTVMKSGEDRDMIAKREHIIAFEMEGAGVWEELPCIVVKGVCDYADSHKHKRWQDFAAATAAAAMKALLETMTASKERVRQITQRRRRMSSISLDMNCHDRSSSGSNKRARVMQSIIQDNLSPQIMLHPVMVVDARGRPLPFHLETVNSKEMFIEILKLKFTDFGLTKIQRNEWVLEDQATGKRVDLSKPWQVVIKPNQTLKMSMVFRRRNVPETQCPSCSFLNSGMPAENIECHYCGLTYRRIEEVQEIEVDSKPEIQTQTKIISQQFVRPRPPKQPNNDEDISRYKHVQIIDTSFQLQTQDSSTPRLHSTSRHSVSLCDFDDLECIGERLANGSGLPEEHCIQLLQELKKELDKTKYAARQDRIDAFEMEVAGIRGQWQDYPTVATVMTAKMHMLSDSAHASGPVFPSEKTNSDQQFESINNGVMNNKQGEALDNTPSRWRPSARLRNPRQALQGPNKTRKLTSTNLKRGGAQTQFISTPTRNDELPISKQAQSVEEMKNKELLPEVIEVENFILQDWQQRSIGAFKYADPTHLRVGALRESVFSDPTLTNPIIENSDRSNWIFQNDMQFEFEPRLFGTFHPVDRTSSNANLDGKDQALSCNAIWERLQISPKVQSGDIDLDGLCSDLQKKAKCSEHGAVVDESDFNAIMRKHL